MENTDYSVYFWVGIACMLPFLTGVLAYYVDNRLNPRSGWGVLTLVVMALLWLGSVGFYVAMGFYGGDYYHNTFEGYWLLGGVGALFGGVGLLVALDVLTN
jgi:threonine/homoserine/homoserine lactone efflux protein